MSSIRRIATATAASLLLGAGVVASTAVAASGDTTLRAVLRDVSGAEVGQVRVSVDDDGTKVTALAKFPASVAGFHGFHIHTTGKCEAAPNANFMSAGGHLNSSGGTHHDHDGDMPVLLVREDGRAEMRFRTDRLDVAELTDGDGAAIIVHALPDNFANIPARYTTGGISGPDGLTQATGDAGPRIACGVLG